jgi:PleD family two-component response regulator
MRLYISEKPFVIENLELNITISLGVTSFKPTKEIDIDMILIDLLKQVDAALYEAKNKGRNCVVYKNLVL